jgi:hypothetical protein
VISGYDRCLGPGLAYSPEKPKDGSLSRGRGTPAVKHISGHQEQIDAFPFDIVAQMFQDRFELT